MGCLLPARSVFQGHDVLALRHSPSTRAGQEESQLQEQASKLEAGSAGRQAKSKFEASFKPVQKATFGSMGCLLRARSVLQGHGVLALRHPSTRAVQEEASCKNKQASWKLAVQERKQNEGLKLVSHCVWAPASSFLWPVLLPFLWSSCFFSALLWLFPSLLFHLSLLQEVWLQNFLCLHTFYMFCCHKSNEVVHFNLRPPILTQDT